MDSNLFKQCKCCHKLVVKAGFDESCNSDDGFHPFCRSCKKLLKKQSEFLYNSYLREVKRNGI